MSNIMSQEDIKMAIWKAARNEENIRYCLLRNGLTEYQINFYLGQIKMGNLAYELRVPDLRSVADKTTVV